MSSKWSPKLEKKLKALGDGASKESIQTHANWIVFNRKHTPTICKTLCDHLLNTTSDARQSLYWSLISEVLLVNSNDPTKWENGAELREALAESTIVPAIEGLRARVVSDHLESLLKTWDEKNVFGGPSLIGQIRRLLAAKGKEGTANTDSNTDSNTAPEAEQKATKNISKASVDSALQVPEAKSKDAEESSKGSEANVAPAVPLTSLSDPPQTRPGSMSSIASNVNYDFENSNVPAGKVESREFLDPCKAVATLQIARDVRNDTPVQLNGFLSKIPTEILEACKGKTEEEYDEAVVRDASMQIPSKLLELDLDEQLQTLQTFQDIVRQQQAARQKLIYLLLKSRCQFGASEAAKQYTDLKDVSARLKRRRQALGDALELEGLDNELDHTNYDEPLEELPPLSWYTGDSEGGASKKARLEA
eukprot:Nitzschia sp. Nitz4//scaffold55_size114948//35827//37150//NITZ4_003893-RA/size114948-processed-gene-0.38-mRNA-1//1//CDS//3329554506//1945//frame0